MQPIVKSIQLPTGVTLPYVEQGDPSGVPVVLLHGYADSWRTFERVLPHLPPSIHVFALTQRGHGDASCPETGYRTHDFVADLTAFMDALALEAAVLVGASSGGFVARRFAIDHPARTLGLVLLGAPFILRDKAKVHEIWRTTISKLTDPIDPDFVRDFQLSTLAHPVPEAFLDIVVKESLKVKAFVWKAVLLGLIQDDADETLHKINAPTLLIWGDQDAILPLTDQQAYTATIPSAELLVYAGGGHTLYWEDPERVAADLAAFVRDTHKGVAQSNKPN